MTSDLQALLAAIVANPADDMARLVYADCLEEQGNAARAQFIRLQIEAERHHPDSNTRATLEAQSRALFEQHWMEWWGEVCAAVGLIGQPDQPYKLAPQGIGLQFVFKPSRESELLARIFPRANAETERRVEPSCIHFRRGFPEAVSIFPPNQTNRGLCAELGRWQKASPLTDLTAEGFSSVCSKDWPDGPHLRSVRRLTLQHHDPLSQPPAFRSANLSCLEDLTLRPETGVYDARFVDVPAMILSAPWGPQIRALDIQLQSKIEGARFLLAEILPQLESLRIDLPWIDEDDDDFDQRRWLEELARSPHLAGLRRLKVTAKVPPDGMVPLIEKPTWANLRHLDLDFLSGSRCDALLRSDYLSELEELRLTGVRLATETVQALVSAPLLKRVRHLALRGGYEDGRVLVPLVDAVDPARIETFAIGIQYFPERAANALRAKFDDRVRFLPL